MPTTPTPLPAAVIAFMARIETKLDQMIDGHADHEMRLRELESRQDLKEDVDKLAAEVAALKEHHVPLPFIQSMSGIATVIAVLVSVFAAVFSIFRH